MSIEENKAVVRRIIDEWWKAPTPDPAVADELIAPDFIDHERPNQQPGPEGVKQGAAESAAAFGGWADLQFTLDELIAEGDKVVALGTWSGTHEGEVQTPVGPVPGTGKQVNSKMVTIFRIANGKLAEQWGIWNELAMLQQIGAIPTPGQANT
jgi:predicted ester cyclase